MLGDVCSTFSTMSIEQHTHIVNGAIVTNKIVFMILAKSCKQLGYEILIRNDEMKKLGYKYTPIQAGMQIDCFLASLKHQPFTFSALKRFGWCAFRQFEIILL